MKLTSERLEQIKEGAGPSAQECAAMVAEIQASREHIPTPEGQGGGEDARKAAKRIVAAYDSWRRVPGAAPLVMGELFNAIDSGAEIVARAILSSPRVEEVRREALEEAAGIAAQVYSENVLTGPYAPMDDSEERQAARDAASEIETRILLFI